MNGIFIETFGWGQVSVEMKPKEGAEVTESGAITVKFCESGQVRFYEPEVSAVIE